MKKREKWSGVPSRDTVVLSGEKKRFCTGSIHCISCVVTDDRPICVYTGPCVPIDRNGNIHERSLCASCGRLVCDSATVGVLGCKKFVPMDVLARTMRNEPPNEGLIRGRC